MVIDDGCPARRSPGRQLRHPRTGKMADFLLTHQGRRVSAYTLREELRRAATEAGLAGVVPHQLRHTYATARSEEHTSELQSRLHLVCRLLLEKKNSDVEADMVLDLERISLERARKRQHAARQ